MRLLLSDCKALGHHINNHELIDERGLRAAAESELVVEKPVRSKAKLQTEFELCFRYAN